MSTKHAMRRSADEIGATSISFRPKVFSGATSVVDGIFSAHRVLHDKNQPRSRRLRACIEGMMNALGVGERLAEIRKSRKISQAKFAPRRRRRYDPELRARTQRAEHNAAGQAAPCGIHLPACNGSNKFVSDCERPDA